MKTTEERLADVERSLRRYRRGTAGAVLVALVGALLGAAESTPPDVVKARRFVVVNEHGAPVVELDAAENGGRIRALNPRGSGVVGLGAGTEGGFLVLTGDPQTGTPALVTLGPTQDGEAQLRLRSSKGGATQVKAMETGGLLGFEGRETVRALFASDAKGGMAFLCKKDECRTFAPGAIVPDEDLKKE